MKDATGELSMTAVAVVAIAAIGVVFTTLIWPQVKSTIFRSSYCSQALYCDASEDGGHTRKCYYCPDDEGAGAGTCGNLQSITCADGEAN